MATTSQTLLFQIVYANSESPNVSFLEPGNYQQTANLMKQLEPLQWNAPGLVVPNAAIERQKSAQKFKYLFHRTNYLLMHRVVVASRIRPLLECWTALSRASVRLSVVYYKYISCSARTLEAFHFWADTCTNTLNSTVPGSHFPEHANFIGLYRQLSRLQNTRLSTHSTVASLLASRFFDG